MADQNEQTVGERTFERVNELVNDGVTRTQAFTKVAKELDSKASTVAANFYRLARKNGQHGRGGQKKQATVRGQRKRGAKRNRTQAQPAMARAKGNGVAPEGDLRELADRLVQTANEIASVMRSTADMDADMRERIERAEAALRG